MPFSNFLNRWIIYLLYGFVDSLNRDHLSITLCFCFRVCVCGGGGGGRCFWVPQSYYYSLGHSRHFQIALDICSHKIISGVDRTQFLLTTNNFKFRNIVAVGLGTEITVHTEYFAMFVNICWFQCSLPVLEPLVPSCLVPYNMCRRWLARFLCVHRNGD